MFSVLRSSKLKKAQKEKTIVKNDNLLQPPWNTDLINQSILVVPRSPKARKHPLNISYESSNYNIYSPKFSSSGCSTPKSSNSSENSVMGVFSDEPVEIMPAKPNYQREADLNKQNNISFNLSDTYDELRNRSGDNPDLDESVEPLLSISPHKEDMAEGV